MKAWEVHADSRSMALVEKPAPTPSAGEIVVRVDAVGVTPTELGWYPTSHNKDGTPRGRAVPGHEFSATVAALGEGVEGVAVGDAIYGMNDWFAEGATAELCVTRPEWIAPLPPRLGAVEAASVPIGALTAWQGLVVRGRLQPGDRVLVHGGAGAVGIYAVQLAHRHGAQVITTASARDREFLYSLGARQVIDYHSERFEDLISEVDVVFDGVGGDTRERSWALLAEGGRLVTIAADAEATSDARVKQAFLLVEPDRGQLIRMGEMLSAGEIIAALDSVVDFAQAERAWLEGGARRGKQVIAIGS